MFQSTSIPAKLPFEDIFVFFCTQDFLSINEKATVMFQKNTTKVTKLISFELIKSNISVWVSQIFLEQNYASLQCKREIGAFRQPKK